MRMNFEESDKLIALERKAKLWDLSFVGVTVGVMIATSIAAYLDSNQEVFYYRLINGAIVGFLAGYVAMGILKGFVEEFVRRQFARTWFIDERENVLRVVGPIFLDDFGFVYSLLLKKRPDYRIAENASELFNCTIAAVPVKQGN